MKLYELTIHEAQLLLKKKEISSLELTESVLERIDELDDKIGAYITIAHENAIRQAKEADKMILRGDIKALSGIPLAIKDLICTKGLRTTCASKILENFIPTYDATVMEKLYTNGAVIVGKTNMDEFAMGSTNENSSIKECRNPWDLTRIPGGSSGGSTSAVAADMCIAALGSDTGGSIRQPASHCSVVGFKPTYGRVSRFGLIAFGSSLDQIGPLTKDVTDAALMMNVISGFDSNDSTSAPEKVPDFTANLDLGLKDVTIGLPKEYFTAPGIDPEVAKAIDDAVNKIESLGAKFVEVSLPNMEYALAAYYVIAPSEACSNLSRYDGVKFGLRDKEKNNLMDMYFSTRTKGFGPEVKRRIILGTYSLSAGYYDAYYRKASKVRTLIIEDFKKAFQDCDVIISPAAPTPAFKIGEKIDDPLAVYMSDIFTLSANMAGIPGISVPCGFSTNGLPIGLQIMADHFDEADILKTAYSFEQATDFHLKKPEIGN